MDESWGSPLYPVCHSVLERSVEYGLMSTAPPDALLRSSSTSSLVRSQVSNDGSQWWEHYPQQSDPEIKIM